MASWLFPWTCSPHYVQRGRVINVEHFSQHYSGVGHWTGSVHRHTHSRRPETIAIRELASEVRRRHYLIVPSANADTRQQETDNIETWAAANNLKLNVSKSKEIVFQDSRQRTAVTPPQRLPDISRENLLKILGVTITSHVSASEYIRQVISDSAQSLFALRVLRHHGMTVIGLLAVFRAVVVSRLTYASPACTGETDDQLFENIEQSVPHTVPVTFTAIRSITEA